MLTRRELLERAEQRYQTAANSHGDIAIKSAIMALTDTIRASFTADINSVDADWGSS